MTTRKRSKVSEWETVSEDHTPTSAFEAKESHEELKIDHYRGSLADELLRKGYHPVMLFGTRAAGKSSLLASLLYYLQSDLDSPAICVLGEWIVPTESSYGQSVADAASRFVNHIMNNFYNGVNAPATRDEVPFYIPIVLRPNNGLPEVKLAFLESRGEWYHIRKNTNNLYPDLRAEVAEVYKKFPNGISILIVAPYVIGDAYDDQSFIEWAKNEMRDSDAAMYGALQAYQTTRQNRELDRYLFVLTKWDAYTKSIIDEEFINPPRGMISHLISERFPRSWTFFQNMQEGEVHSMQYSAGIMSGDARVEVPQNLRPIMNRYPMMLWRWLYYNSSGGADLFTGKSEGQDGVEDTNREGSSTRPIRKLSNWLRKIAS